MHHDRLPISHPEYRYPPSRNPYWKKLHDANHVQDAAHGEATSTGIAGRVFADNETETKRGAWRSVFPGAQASSPARALASRPLHVEIGCNAGHVIVEWAKSDAKADWIGIDWKFKPIFRAAEKGLKRGLGNLLFLRAHGERIPFIFGPAEIDHLYLFFPDPWPRKKQWKNRFLTAQRLREIAPLLKPGTGQLHIRTDHLGYFEWMEAAVAELAADPAARDLFEITMRTNDRHAAVADPLKLEIPEVTLFERLWIRDGIKINAMTLRRR